MRSGSAQLRFLPALLFIAGTLVVHACSHSTAPGCVDLCFTSAIANVFVHDSSGQPVAGAAVGVKAYALQCAGDYLGGESGGTDSAGHRRLILSSLYSPHTARCFLVMVGPLPTPSGPVDTVQVADSVQFRAEDGTPRDSVRFDMVVAR